MAQRRMFNKTIIDSDAFLDMALSTQALYFHLCMRADDDGFVNNPKKIRKMVGAAEDDLKVLIAKRFILVFENGVIVIKHWRIHNLLRRDRYTPTQYQSEMHRLELKENGAYTEATVPAVATEWQPDGNREEDRKGEVNTLHPLPSACAPAQEEKKTIDEERETVAVPSTSERDITDDMENAELSEALLTAPGTDSAPEEKAAHDALIRHIKSKRRLHGLYTSGIMLSDYQWENLCEQLSADEIEHYIDVLKTCIKKGHTPRSHYAFIMHMVEQDRRISLEKQEGVTT